MSRYAVSTICMRFQRFPTVTAYNRDLAAALSSESARKRLQNFMLKQFNFPAHLHKGEHVAEFWSHQLQTGEWHRALEALRYTQMGGRFLIDDASDPSFLAMAQSLVGKKFKATGAIAVHFADPLNGRSMIRITVVGVYHADRVLFSGNEGPHVLHSIQPKDAFPNIFLGALLTPGYGVNPLPLVREREDVWKNVVAEFEPVTR